MNKLLAVSKTSCQKKRGNKMEYVLVIPGKLHNLNDYIYAERSNRYVGSQMKKADQELIIQYVKQQLKGIKIEKPVFMEYTWYEINKQRDKDNISSYGRKIIQDGLVKSGVLQGDGWGDIDGFSDTFEVDKENPRVEVRIIEV